MAEPRLRQRKPWQLFNWENLGAFRQRSGIELGAIRNSTSPIRVSGTTQDAPHQVSRRTAHPFCWTAGHVRVVTCAISLAITAGRCRGVGFLQLGTFLSSGRLSVLMVIFGIERAFYLKKEFRSGMT
jgi:hypothetical protein